MWVDCGGFDTDFPPLEDWEFWIHAAKLGWGFQHIPQVAFDYRVRPESLVKAINSVEVWEGFCQRVRNKHPEFYWNVAVGRFELLKAEIESMRSQMAVKDEVIRELKSEVEDTNSKIAEKDGEIQHLGSELASESQKAQALSARVAAHEAERTHSFAWRVLNGYGRIKYRYLLPIYRLFGRAPVAGKETMRAPNNTSHARGSHEPT